MAMLKMTPLTFNLCTQWLKRTHLAHITIRSLTQIVKLQTNSSAIIHSALAEPPALKDRSWVLTIQELPRIRTFAPNIQSGLIRTTSATSASIKKRLLNFSRTMKAIMASCTRIRRLELHSSTRLLNRALRVNTKPCKIRKTTM